MENKQKTEEKRRISLDQDLDVLQDIQNIIERAYNQDKLRGETYNQLYETLEELSGDILLEYENEVKEHLAEQIPEV